MKLPAIAGQNNGAAGDGSPKYSGRGSAKSRGFTIGSKYPRKDPWESVPGPGSYYMPPKAEGPAFSIHAKFCDKPMLTPGPGSYDLIKAPLAAASRAPAFTFGGKHESPVRPTPGPAEYSPRAVSKSMGITIGKRFPNKPNNYPGPGAYSVVEPPPSAPVRVPAATHRRGAARKLVMNKQEPEQQRRQDEQQQQGGGVSSRKHLAPLGDVQAVAIKPTGEGVGQVPESQQPPLRPESQLDAWSGHGSPLVWARFQSPSPPVAPPSPSPPAIGKPATIRGGSPTPPLQLSNLGASNGAASQRSSPSPSPSIKGLNFNLALPRSGGISSFPNTPGPGRYNARSSASTPPPFTVAVRRSPRQDEPSPGPGYYTPKTTRTATKKLLASSASTSPKTSGPAGALLTKPARNPAPGPGAYDVVKPSASSSPSYTMGNRAVPSDHASKLPGPGAYHHSATAGAGGPAFTMPGKVSPLQATSARSPGPGAYDTTTVAATSPSFTFGKKTSPTLKPEKTPGPGSYHNSSGSPVATARSLSPVNSDVSRGSGRKRQPQPQVPGPGAYDPSPSAAGPRAPAYTLGVKLPSDEPPRSPGPAAYTPRLKQQGPRYSLATRTELPTASETPGPGAHHRPAGPSGPKITMGLKLDDAADAASGAAAELPGPGEYWLKTRLDSPAYRIGARPTETRPSDVPGPGTYSPAPPADAPAFSLAAKLPTGPPPLSFAPGPGTYPLPPSPRGPAFSIRGKPVAPAIEESPGPGTYHIRDQPTPGFTVGIRPKESMLEKTPGPGAYGATSCIGEGSSYTLAFLLPPPPPSEVPGPGAYTISSRPETPLFSMYGKIKRKEAEESPGPGAYDRSDGALGGPELTMAPRTLGNAPWGDDVPGPGKYPVTTPRHSPSYTMLSRPADRERSETPGPGTYDPAYGPFISLDSTPRSNPSSVAAGGASTSASEQRVATPVVFTHRSQFKRGG